MFRSSIFSRLLHPLWGTAAPLLTPHSYSLKTQDRCVDQITLVAHFFQPEVDTNDSGWDRQRGVGHLEFTHQSDVPVVPGIPLECGALRGSVNGSRLPDGNRADLRDRDFPVQHRDTLWNTEAGLVPFAALESRKTRPFLKEVPVGAVKIGQRLLECLRVGFLQPRCFWLPLQFGETARKFGGGQSLARLLKVPFPLIESPIPHKSASASHPRKTFALCARRLHAKSKYFAQLHLRSLRFWFSMYCLTTANGEPPTVDTKYEFVQSVGSLVASEGNARRNVWELLPFIRKEL
jgi:hypothetical protein